jgi:NADH dehydrogenase
MTGPLRRKFGRGRGVARDGVNGRHRVVVVGGGFGGLPACRFLGKLEVDVTLIDRRNHHLFQPLLYQVATAALNAADVAFPIRGVTRRYKNCSFHHGDVTSIDHDSRVVHLADGDIIAYDYLIVGAGARAAYFDVPGAESHAFALYSLADATRLRNHILRCVEQADAHPELIDRGLLTFVVVGGGPTGVEMAGGLFEVCIGILRKDFPALRDHTARVILIERLDVVLSAFHAKSQTYALKALRRRGVDVRFGETVAAVEKHALLLASGERIDTSTVIWAGGVQTETLAGNLGAEQSRGSRVVVMPNLSVEGHPDVFVIGDMANASASDGRAYPQVAQVAIQSGQHAAGEVERRIKGQSTKPFAYKNKGIMATIGRRSAVTELPSGFTITGTLGWLSWLFLHLLYLVGFRNRLSVLLNWAWSYATKERGPRLIFGADELDGIDEVSRPDLADVRRSGR